jgi:hypothetical protein
VLISSCPDETVRCSARRRATCISGCGPAPSDDRPLATGWMCLRRCACASSRYRPGERTYLSGKSRIITNPHARRYIVTGFPDNSARIFGLSRTLPAEPTASPDPAPGRAEGPGRHPAARLVSPWLLRLALVSSSMAVTGSHTFRPTTSTTPPTGSTPLRCALI